MPELGAILFDFDGTIADSEPLHLAAFQMTVGAELNLELGGDEYAERYLAYDDRRFFEAFLADRGAALPPERFERLLRVKEENYRRLAEEAPPLFPGAEEMVRAAAARWPLAVASGALDHEVRPVLERAGLIGCFAAIVTAEMVRRGKPDPESFLTALAALNRARGGGIAPAACLVVEDSLAGLEAARAAGMRALAVATSYPRERLGRADRVVDSLEETAAPEPLAAWFAALPAPG